MLYVSRTQTNPVTESVLSAFARLGETDRPIETDSILILNLTLQAQLHSFNEGSGAGQ